MYTTEKISTRLKNHLSSQARNHKSLCALGSTAEPCAVRQQDITWANVVQDHCRHMESLGLNESIPALPW